MEAHADRTSWVEMVVSLCQGRCYEFAVAVARGTGYPLRGIFMGGEILHVGVVLPNGNLLDARGKHNDAYFRSLYDAPPDTLVSVTEEGLFEVRARAGMSIDEWERLLSFARKNAEVLFPNLPWIRGTQCDRDQGFLEELAQLCARYKIALTEIP